MKHREFFVDPVVIIPIDPCKPMYHVAFTEHGGESSLLHVIEYAAIEELEAENARLKEKRQVLRRYHGGDGTVTREQVMEALEE